MIKNLILSLLLFANMECAKETEAIGYYKEALRYIETSSMSKEFSSQVYNTDSISIKVFTELVPIGISNFQEEIIVKNYDSDYKLLKDLSDDQIELENKVVDSLLNADANFNRQYTPNKKQYLSTLNSANDTNFIVLFSEVQDNYLYAELIPNKSNGVKSESRETIQYGKALTFLFKFKKGRTVIEEVFHGQVFNN